MSEHHAPRPVPRAGPCYELFNLAVLLAVIAVCNYVLGTPSPGTRATLAWLLGPTSQMVWGVGLTIAGIVGAGCAYHQPFVRAGFGIIGAAAFLWCFALIIGIALDVADRGDFQWSGLASATLYGFLARQAAHELRET